MRHRPPTSIPGSPAALALGVDMGRTKIAVGVVDATGDVLDSVVAPAPRHGVRAAADALLHLSRDLLARHQNVEAVGVGTAEVVKWPSGVALVDDGTTSFPLRDHVEQALSLPVVVDSDANVAALAEFRFGAAAGRRDIVVLTVGTGIGAGFLIDGKLFRGVHGFAGEVGHCVVQPFGELCNCGNVGCWETVASGTALGRRGRRAAAGEPDGLIARLAGSATDVTGLTVYEAAIKGDTTAMMLFQQLGAWLGVGIASLVLTFDPEIVVVGGGLSRAGDLLLEPARSTAARRMPVRNRSCPPVVEAQYRSCAGLVGAAVLAFDVHLSSAEASNR